MTMQKICNRAMKLQNRELMFAAVRNSVQNIVQMRMQRFVQYLVQIAVQKHFADVSAELDADSRAVIYADRCAEKSANAD